MDIPEEMLKLADRIEDRFNHPPTKYNKYLSLIRRSDKGLVVSALRLAASRLATLKEENNSGI